METRVYLIPASSEIFNNKTYAEISVYEILEFADGWNGYATMTEEDYNELIKLLK